jgi:ring-1,2-phenylacetyl-CoA epoxidase subunit PaaD
VLRNVEQDGDQVVVTITPTYSGCPAMGQIEDDIKPCAHRAGIDDVDSSRLPTRMDNRMDERRGQAKLEDFGIAPPTARSDVRCPQVPAEGPAG